MPQAAAPKSGPATPRVALSIVATLYNSAPHLAEFHRRAGAAARALAGEDYEIVLVNDGSPDASGTLAQELVRADPRTVLVDLSRNFGHHKAMMTGLEHAYGARVLLIDSDLEEEPEWLARFAAVMADTDADVVFGVQEMRKGGFLERWSGLLFYRVFRLLTGVALPENMVTARLMTRRYVDALLRHQEREVFMAGLWHITGFEQTPVPVRKHSNGHTTYSLRRKLALFVNSIVSFTNRPLVGIFWVGIAIATLATIYIVYLLAQKLFFATPLEGWTSVMASVWLLGGIIITFMGVIGIYLSKVFSETKQRPYTIIRQIHEHDDR
jgi:putative glycosyltransferase